MSRIDKFYNNIDREYNALAKNILDNGFWYEDPKRKDVMRLQLRRATISHDLTANFPAIAGKKLAWKSVVGELIWFLRGDTNIKYLVDNGIPIWNKDAYSYYKQTSDEVLGKNEFKYSFEEFMLHVKTHPTHKAIAGSDYKFGDLGRVYGAQMRSWKNGTTEGLDQINALITNLKNTPMATDHLVSMWNPAEKDQQALPPCHFGFQILCEPLTVHHRAVISKWNHSISPTHEELDDEGVPRYGFELIWDQRSVDVFLGLPFNIASYAMLAHIIGEATNMLPLKLTGDLRNVHLYENSIGAIKTQLKRPVSMAMNPKIHIDGALATRLRVEGVKAFDDMQIQNFKLLDYTSGDALKVAMLSRD